MYCFFSFSELFSNKHEKRRGFLHMFPLYFPLEKLCPGCLTSGGNSCKSHELPSGSRNSADLTVLKSVTSPIAMPRFRSASRALFISSTTRCSPFTDAGVIAGMSPIPVPKTMVHAEPGGVNWTTLVVSLVGHLPITMGMCAAEQKRMEGVR